ncbi:putative ABC transport system permease protein [Algoriphagus aquaeductus]|uniref:Putative ABC transport system permease protein n=1 Tax=Algoriphagus aquaeductus TaxID=475299 RepID=A0A326RZX0_9BACT|nr:ABC transporter permease [Algoriphagus aquaeductus]PZV87341.1 putative ABC transport system permease protein [Algoriphagus aquaeductus]
MILNYLRVSLRSLLKRSVFSSVNLVGLILGLVTFLVLFAFVATQWSYNEFHIRKDDLYRVVVTEGKGDYEIFLPPGYGPILKSNFEEVESVLRIASGIGSGLLAVPDTDLAFTEEQISFVEGDFFRAFSFDIVRGNADLSRPKTAVLSESFAQKLFGDQDPLGKIFSLSNQFGKTELTVTGVIAAISPRSDFQGEVFVSIHTLENPAYRQGNDWANPDGLESGFVNLILLTKAGVSGGELSERLTSFIQKNPGSENSQVLLQPFREIHLGGSIGDPMPSYSEMGSVLVFLAIAVLILAIAYVNYLNLSSASILTRIKEIRMRRILGARSWQLAQQFMAETLVLMILALVISSIILVIIAPYLDQVFGTPIWLWALGKPSALLAILILLGFCVLISGFYVVFLSGRFEKKSRMHFKLDHQWLRKSLVVFQFVISGVIITCTLVIRDQLTFMQNQNLGMNVSQKVAIAGPNDIGDNRDAKINSFRDALSAKSYIKGLAGSNNIPGIGYNFSAGGFSPQVPRPEDEEHTYSMLIVDEQFFTVYEIDVLAGRNFTPDETKSSWNSSYKVILNEKAARQLGFENPESAAGQTILWGKPFEVVGVVRDYHHMSLREEIRPSVFLPSQAGGFFTLILEPSRIKEHLEEIKNLYQDIFPGNPFNYSFTDEVFARQYRTEAQLSLAFSIAGILAIVISCLGLFGLAAYSVQQRTKEIGIRKVLGASSESLVRLVSKDFMILVGLAILLAIPIAWYVMRAWQMDFPYQAGLSLTTFVSAGALSLFVALLTVGFQAVRAAWANPVDSIQNE